MKYRRHWLALALVFFSSFAILISQGVKLHRSLPPIPERVVDTSGAALFAGEAIHQGQNVWQSLGGQQMGSIWGHGAYVAPDWTADWLHREATFVLDTWARAEGLDAFASADPDDNVAGSKRDAQNLVYHLSVCCHGVRRRCGVCKPSHIVLRILLFPRQRLGH